MTKLTSTGSTAQGTTSALQSVDITDFYLGLAAFHFLVAITTLAVVRRPRWLGPTALALVLVLGVAT